MAAMTRRPSSVSEVLRSLAAAALFAAPLGCGGHSGAAPGDGGPATSSDGAEPGKGDGGPAGDAGACASGTPWTDPGAAEPAIDPAQAGVVHHYYAIAVVDGSHAPVAGATLTTTNQIVYTADSNGKVAFYEPGLMDTGVWFTPSCAGYTVPADGFGNAGVALHPTEGGAGTITMTKSGAPGAPVPGDLQTRLLAGPVPGPAQCFAVRATDSVTGRGVPLVRFVTGSDAYESDSQGYVAYCDPDVIGKSVTFAVTSDGYALASGGSVTFTATAGGAANVPLVRQLPGQRLYRATGQGIFRDSALLDRAMPTAHPNLDGLVMGQDTPVTIASGGTLYWFWGDTVRPAYPLGNFDTSGATSSLPADGGLSPDLGVDTTYYVDGNGFSRGMIDTTGDPLFTSGTSAPVWIGQTVQVMDGSGQPHVFGKYYVAASKDPWSALTEFDPSTAKFEFVTDYPPNATLPAGRGIVVRSPSGSYAYWSNPLRFPATVAGAEDLAGYEVFSPYQGTGASATLAHNADGTLAYAWRAGGTLVTQAALGAANVAADQALDGHLTDVVAGGNVQVANGPGASLFGSSAMWNDSRKRFSEIVQQEYGASFLGESWYAEADAPLGPWVYARKVVTHAQSGMTFYNPDIVPELSEAGGRVLFFDATYTKTYTSLSPTPRYDYNEMMYRVDLDDPEMALPVAIYARGSGSAAELAPKAGVRPGDPPMAPEFFAYDRAARGAVPVAWDGPACGPRRLTVGGAPATTPLFYALPPGASDAGPPAALPLYEYAGPGGAYVYSVEPSLGLAGFTRGAAVAEVWPSPIRVALPVADFLGNLVADAGADQCVGAGPDGTAAVTLDASATSNLGGAAAQYSWSLASGGCPIAAGEKATVVLPAGVSDVVLVVTDSQGKTSKDEVIVRVQ